MKTLKTSILIALCLLLLSSCGGAYSSKFNCPDASGYGCTSIDVIDQRISSRQIEELNAPKHKKNCNGRSCRHQKHQQMKPTLKEQKPTAIEFVGK